MLTGNVKWCRQLTWRLSRMALFSDTAPTVSSASSPLVRNQPQTDIATTRARLLYQSKKRGILENDILLGEFAESHLPDMTAKELAEYDKLINGEHMEWDLFYYIAERKEPPAEVATLAIFKKLKAFVDDKKKLPNS